MNIGDRIKERRKYLGLSVDEVADRLKKNRATIYRYESNDIENFPVTILEPLAQILQTTPTYLMGLEDELNSELSSEEKILLTSFNKLNDLGKKEANKRVSELTEISKYIDENTITTFAAHDDELDPDKAKERIEKAKEIFKQMDEEK